MHAPPIRGVRHVVLAGAISQVIQTSKMIHRHLLTALVTLLGAQAVFAQAPMDAPRRLEVLFLGDDAGHKPLERYRVLKQVLGPKGINLTFVEDLSNITRENLDLYDALLVYANHEEEKAPEAIFQWVKDGGGLVALHSACGNFHPSKEWFDLVTLELAAHEVEPLLGGMEIPAGAVKRD
ncbi:MAG: hypothetical protein EOP87_11815, partial [Verrucomicrobiaceae bacterium]